MEEKELAAFIDAYFTKMRPNFQWKVVKNSVTHTVEVFFTFQVPLPSFVQVQDSQGTRNRSGELNFEDVICFYDAQRAHIAEEAYLQTFAFDAERGIEEGYVEAVCKHLNIVATQGSAELRDYVSMPTTDDFELQWHAVNFENTLQTLKDLNRYNPNRLKMDVQTGESFLEQLKGSMSDDDVERI